MSVPHKDPLPQILHRDEVKKQRYAYHAHAVAEVCSVLGTSTNGLEERDLEKQRDRYGRNIFTPPKQISWLTKIVTQLTSPFAVVLLVACALTLALQEIVDAAVIAIALLVAVVVGIFQEGRASRAFSTLASSQVQKATVVRGGLKHEIDTADLVVGDLVVLQEGVRVPADLRLVSAKRLSLNEATLTGEWRNVEKGVDPVSVGTPLSLRTSMVYMGTYVAEGYGTGIVVAVGDSTEVGKIAASMRDIEDVKTPLQDEMMILSQRMFVAISLVVVAIFVLGVIIGQPLREMLLMAVAIAVASVPEGLPAAVTIILAVSMESLLRKGGLVRNLLAAETLGATTYVLTDKTGTLTYGEMKVVGLLATDGELVKEADFKHFSDARKILEISLAATEAYLDHENGKEVLRGDSVERAILDVARQEGIDDSHDSWRSLRVDYLPFTSEQRYAAGLVQRDGQYLLCVNGAPQMLLHEATHVLQEGGLVEITDEIRTRLHRSMEIATKEGQRLIGVGYAPVTYKAIPEHRRSLFEELVFVGAFVMADPVREGVEVAISGVKSAGARVILVTGDHPETALAIARTVGIADIDDVALTGSDLDTLTDDELWIALKEVTVFARVLPEQKLRIANLLEIKGEVVAMTGDGVNDAPALRRANIGIAIGSGTDVAREAADLVLMNDSFSIIYSAIEEGRRIVANLRKIVGYLLATSLSEVVLIGTALVVGGPLPLVPAQILWANVIEEGLMSVAFAFEKGERDAMRRRPHDVHEEGLVSQTMLGFILFVVIILGTLNIALYHFVLSLNVSEEVLRSIMFLSIAMDSLYISFSFRSLSTPIWRISFSGNPFFFAAFFLSAGLLALVLTVPFFQYLLSYTPLPIQFMLPPILVGLLGLIAIELGKWLFFERQR